jgi:hypothetical protein
MPVVCDRAVSGAPACGTHHTHDAVLRAQRLPMSVDSSDAQPVTHSATDLDALR